MGADAYFDRFDICEAYFVLDMDYNVGGSLRERSSNRRRHESVGVQLYRMGFVPSPLLEGYESLTENGKAIYDAAVERWGLPRD